MHFVARGSSAASGIFDVQFNLESFIAADYMVFHSLLLTPRWQDGKYHQSSFNADGRTPGCYLNGNYTVSQSPSGRKVRECLVTILKI
jgi:hypothetical protein